MKYGVYINQFAISQAGFDFDLTDAAVFDMLKDYCNSKACKKMMHDGMVYYNVQYKLVIDELPLAKLKKPDSVYRRFQKLEQNGIIEMHPDNRVMKQVWFAWGRNYERMLSTYKTGSKSDQTPDQYGLESDTTDLNPVYYGLESGLSTDLNPALPNTISINYPQLALERARENEPETFDLEAEKDTTSQVAPTPAGGRRANTSDEAETLIRAWANGDGKETVKNWIAETTFSEKVHGRVRDEITKFVGHYAVSEKPGVSHKMFADPVLFFQNRFKAWLVQAKELNRPANNQRAAAAATYEPPRRILN